MLENTFIHIPGVGRSTEISLWRQGCSNWDTFIDPSSRYSCGQADANVVRLALRKSKESLAAGRHQFFRQSLGRKESWRAYPEFKHSVVYLDIETDGGQTEDAITMIGLYDGADFTCLIKGQDLANFQDIISHYSMIVTFSGAGFDLPVLQRCFTGLRFDQIHIDLCPTLHRLGLFGGLKAIEKELGIERSPETAGLSGWDAVTLWNRYLRNHDDKALETLIAYNREDVVNLEKLMHIAYEGLKQTVYAEAEDQA